MVTECVMLAAPFGRIELWEESGQIARVVLSPETSQRLHPEKLLSRTVADLQRQIERYLENPRQPIRWETSPCGTDFQKRVWRALSRIPSGEVRTYGELARELVSGPRAVAGACRANPWPLIVPCHRIVAANGEGGYCGQTQGPYLAIKRWLLAHEGWH
jgi:methylated-DNA-[protein]-cysteine S-methyltransferase